MNLKLNYTKDKLLTKDFTTALKGYRAEEVDTVLDEVVHDYEEYDRAIKSLSASVDALKVELEDCKAKLLNLQTVLKDTQSKAAGESQLSILRSLNDIRETISKMNEEMKVAKSKP